MHKKSRTGTTPKREMKTPMQELLEWVRTTLPMDLDTSRMIEAKIESMLEKEKEVIMNAYIFGIQDEYVIGSQRYYNETFNTKEK
jgi:hypothetical protein